MGLQNWTPKWTPSFYNFADLISFFDSTQRSENFSPKNCSTAQRLRSLSNDNLNETRWESKCQIHDGSRTPYAMTHCAHTLGREPTHHQSRTLIARGIFSFCARRSCMTRTICVINF